MRVNVYAEEITDRVELVEKDGFTGLRFYLELPVTEGSHQHRGPFMHKEGDDDSAAVTFWGKRQMQKALRLGLDLLTAKYGSEPMIEVPASHGLLLIARERLEQKNKHGYDAAHDDKEDEEQLDHAARHILTEGEFPWPWPNDHSVDRVFNCSRIEQLAKVGALCAAEIDRLKRLENKDSDAAKE